MTSEKENNKVTSKKEKNKPFSGIAAFSILISLFDKLGEIIYNALVTGFFGRIFTAYSALRKKISNGFFGTYVVRNSKIKRFFRKIREFLARNIEPCLTLSLANKAIDKFCSFPLQYYGNYGLFFGLYTIVIYFVKQFVPWLEPAPSLYLWTGIVVSIASVPLLFSRINLANSVKNSVIGRGIFKNT